MPILDELTGHEFEKTMGDVFRNSGYENVRVSSKTGDEGRDIIMEEVVNGERRSVVVECKHQQRVGRPVIQKLHSAITTHNYDGPKRGILVTTGTVSNEAQKYVQKIRNQGDGTLIEIIEGSDLRKRAGGSGLDLHNGRVEIICDQTLPPTNSSGDVDAPIQEAFESIDNFDPEDLPETTSTVTFNPVIRIRAMTKAKFETTVGVIHRVNERDSFFLRADERRPKKADDTMQQLASNRLSSSVSIDRPKFDKKFEASVATPFENTKTEYREWSLNHLQQKHTSTVEYKGDNDVTYDKECVPDKSDINLVSIDPVYVPEVSSQITIQDNTYTLNYYAAGSDREIIDDGIRRCVHCGEDKWWPQSFTYCDNCGSISCRIHTKTERIEGKPICSGCAITEQFALRKMHFSTEENREQFSERYDQMALHEKALENKPVLVSVAFVLVLILIWVI